MYVTTLVAELATAPMCTSWARGCLPWRVVTAHWTQSAAAVGVRYTSTDPYEEKFRI